MKYDYFKLAQILRKSRIKKNITLKELGEKVGTSYSEISKIENGTKPNFSFVLLINLCNELEINFEDLLVKVGLKNKKNGIELKEKMYFILFENKTEDVGKFLDWNDLKKELDYEICNKNCEDCIYYCPICDECTYGE